MAFELPFGHAIIGSTMLLALIIVEVIAGEPIWLRTAGDLALAAVIVIALVSAAFSPWRSIALWSALGLAVSSIVATRGAVLAAARNPRVIVWTLGTWACAGVGAAAASIALLGAGIDARADLPGLGYNSLGTALAIASVLMLGFTLSGSRARRLAALCGLAILIAALALTFSRGGWLGAIVGGTVLAASTNLRRALPAIAAVVIVGTAVVAAMAPRWAWHLDRLQNIAVAEGPFSRIAIWRVVPGMVAARPILGWGLGMFPWAHGAYAPTAQMPQHPPSAHNLVLNFAVETGLIGAAAMVAFLVARLGAGVRWLNGTLSDSPERIVSATTLAAIAAALATQMVDVTLMRVNLALGFFALLGFASVSGRRGRDAVIA
jgi:hypothetical protein